MFKVITNIAATIIDDLFAIYHSYPNNIVTIFAQNLSLLFQVSVQFITVKILYSISYGSLIWNMMAGYIKDSKSLDIFKSKIRKWKAINCPCCVCKKYIPNTVFINQIWFIIFADDLRALDPHQKQKDEILDSPCVPNPRLILGTYKDEISAGPN